MQFIEFVLQTYILSECCLELKYDNAGADTVYIYRQFQSAYDVCHGLQVVKREIFNI